MDEACRIDLQRTRGGDLRAQVTGVRSVAATVAYWDAILDEVARDKPAGLLVIDELVGEELSASEWKKLVVHVQGRGLDDVPIAHVKPFSIDQVNYCERYANELGMHARAFRREDEAAAWLQAQTG